MYINEAAIEVKLDSLNDMCFDAEAYLADKAEEAKKTAEVTK